MKVTVIGSRTFKDYDLLVAHLRQCAITLVITGGAKGADALALDYATDAGIPSRVFIPDWKKYQRGAGHVRNRQMVDACDAVLAFWDGQSKGTHHTMRYAASKGKPVQMIRFKNE
jgi:predicted Rossmann fold nucleotide-binding protein DprA/Smf involved in DNA uptake